MFKAFFDTAEDRDIPFVQMWEASWPCWDWAEPSDKLENTLACNLSALQRDAVKRSAAIMDSNLKFLRRRLHADVDCAENMLAATDPAATFEVVTSFWRQLYEDYQERAATMAAILQQPVDLSDDPSDAEGQPAKRGEGSADGKSIIAIDRHKTAKAAKAA